MTNNGERTTDRHINPFASEKGIKAIARAMSIVLSEHYGEEIVVTFVPKTPEELKEDRKRNELEAREARLRATRKRKGA